MGLVRGLAQQLQPAVSRARTRGGRITRHADDAALLAEEPQRLDGPFGQADDPSASVQIAKGIKMQIAKSPVGFQKCKAASRDQHVVARNTRGPAFFSHEDDQGSEMRRSHDQDIDIRSSLRNHGGEPSIAGVYPERHFLRRRAAVPL
jgi:hypothetical protein